MLGGEDEGELQQFTDELGQQAAKFRPAPGWDPQNQQESVSEPGKTVGGAETKEQEVEELASIEGDLRRLAGAVRVTDRELTSTA